MQGQERILRERFARIACVACGSCHRQDDMLVLAQRGSRWLLLLTCWRCQRRGIFVASFPRATQLPEPLDAFDAPPTLYQAPATPQWLTPSSAPLAQDSPGMIDPYPAHPFEEAAVTSGDVESIKHFLEGFNGDFRTLFGPTDGLARG